MREKRWLLLALYGLVLATAVHAAIKPGRKFKIATTTTSTTSPSTTDDAHDNENDDNESTTVAAETNGTTGHTLTGIPQIDYIWDPNLPRELNGYNLSDYPFYNSIPEDIDFKCDGLHDGFYASVPHKCQVYHHCLFGTRYDFLCANFTAFDQKTFICHFVSEVDCANSKKYWHRNDALYKAATTSTTSTTSTTTTTTVPPVTVATGRSNSRDRDLPARRRRPFRRRPAYEYYDDDLYYDDEYGRPRGYARDEYEYDDRKYRRDRDRDFRERDRDFRDRDSARSRGDSTDRERDVTVRERFPPRNNRRDPPRTRDPPVEEETRVRPRDPDQNVRYQGSREVGDPDLDDRRVDAKTRDPDDRRYSEKRYRDDYDDKDLAPSAGATSTNTEGLVKPAAPLASVYARPRTPPKIRRPVPLSEQDRYAYKASPVQSTEEPRRRPAEEDDYYEDELEEVRPMRRPLRRRPSYRERDRDFYDTRDRDRDRPYRARYRDDEDDARPRKHPDRSRDRYYDRERDRIAGERVRERGKDRSPDRSLDRDRGRGQDDRQERPYSPRLLDIDREQERSRPTSRSKETSRTVDSLRRPSHDRTTERTTSTTTTSTTTTTCIPEHLIRKVEEIKEPVTERPSSRTTQHPRVIQDDQEIHTDLEKSRGPQHSTDYLDKDLDEGHRSTPITDEYSSEYYDDPEEPPATLPPRTPVRIVKRPFLPSRGGIPNPRGLQSVGSKATVLRKDEEKERIPSQDSKGYYDSEVDHQDDEDIRTRLEEKHTYDAYKTVQEVQVKGRNEDYDTSIGRPLVRRPIDRQRDEEVTPQQHGEIDIPEHHEEVSHLKWADDYPGNPNTGTNENLPTSGSRGKGRIVATENPSYASSYKTEENQENQPTGPGNFRAKQKLNEVTHRLQDIPESEYDVTLNEALTPTLNQEPNLPSGFVLPLHRQLGRDAVLQPSENNYKISRPAAVTQQQSSQQQKPFVPSPEYVPAGVSSNERLRTVFYRTPESVQISGAQYRQHRGPWHDYTGY